MTEPSDVQAAIRLSEVLSVRVGKLTIRKHIMPRYFRTIRIDPTFVLSASISAGVERALSQGIKAWKLNLSKMRPSSCSVPKL